MLLLARVGLFESRLTTILCARTRDKVNETMENERKIVEELRKHGYVVNSEV